MAPHHGAVGHPLEGGHAHVVAVQHLDHAGAHSAQNMRGHHHGECGHRQDDLREKFGQRRISRRQHDARQPTQPATEDQDKQGGRHKFGDGHGPNGQCRQDQVQPFVPAQSGQNAGDKGQWQSDGERRDAQQQRVLEPVRHQDADALGAVGRKSQVTLQGGAGPIEVAQRCSAVQAQFLAAVEQALALGVLFEQSRASVTGQRFHRQKNNQRDQPDCDRAQHQPPQNHSQHGLNLRGDGLPLANVAAAAGWRRQPGRRDRADAQSTVMRFQRMVKFSTASRFLTRAVVATVRVAWKPTRVPLVSQRCS